MPTPPPINSQRFRCRGEASTSRGNQASGTVTVLPSDKATLNVFSVHATSIASTSVRSTEVRMPSPQEKVAIVDDDLPDGRQLMIPEPAYVSERDRLEPKLGVPAGVSHMNVRRLAAFHAEE